MLQNVVHYPSTISIDLGEMMKMHNASTERILYWVSIGVILFVAVFYSLHVWYVNISGHHELLECMLKKTAGIPCPGCGGTRALRSLASGDILASLRYNSFATYGAILYFVFFVTHTLEIVTKERIKGIKFRLIYLWLAICILIVQYVLKLFIPYFYV